MTKASKQGTCADGMVYLGPEPFALSLSGELIAQPFRYLQEKDSQDVNTT